jgi:hypothetical protein
MDSEHIFESKNVKILSTIVDNDDTEFWFCGIDWPQKF